MKQLYVLLLGVLLVCGAADAQGASAFDRWLGQRLVYAIDFLWFDSIAQGSLLLQQGETAGTYRAVLEARTLGVAAWLTSDRVQRYDTLMEQTAEGSLRAISYEARIIKGEGAQRKDRSSRYLFDHARRQVLFQKGKNGVFGEQKVLPVPEGVIPSDILTAFFNFQAGYYGAIVPGGRYRIPTFSKKGVAHIEAEVLSGPLAVRPDFFPAGGWLVKVVLDPEVFGSSGGVLYIQFNEQLQPLRGIVENVIGLGDVYGTLTNSPKLEP